jgi:predicted  nucleic acid-binding Zn-ribbon protein
MLVAHMDAISGKFKEVDVQLERLRKSVKVLENTIADIQRKLATKR